jgi:hypothetical protein
MNSKRKTFSGFWALIGALVLLMICITPAHPLFIGVWVAMVLAWFAGFRNTGNGDIYREQVRSFGIGMFALATWFAFEGDRMYAALVGALLSLLVFWLSRLFGPRPPETADTGTTATTTTVAETVATGATIDTDTE